MRYSVCVAALALLLTDLAPASAADKPARVDTRQSWFTIPFEIEPTNRVERQPVRVQLHARTEPDGEWRLVGEESPKSGRFGFRAPHDGAYGFMVRTIDRTGNLRPNRAPAPELIVVVDTVSPQIELSALRGPAGEVTARWRVEDDQVNADSLRLAYQSEVGGSAWQEVAVSSAADAVDSPVLEGDAVLPVVGMRTALNLRLEVRDMAGNPAVAQATVEPIGARASIRQTSMAQPSPQSFDVRPSSEANTADLHDAAANLNQASTGTPGVANDTIPWESDRTAVAPFEQDHVAAPPVATEHSAGSQLVAGELLPPVQPSRVAPISASAPANSPGFGVPDSGNEQLPFGGAYPPPPSGGFAVEEGQLYDPGQEVVAPSPAGPVFNAGANPSPSTDGPENTPSETDDVRGATDRPRMVCSTRFELEYDIETLGPSGVARVELWGTRDGGQSWLSYGVDDDGRSPLVANVESEGMYGFIISVRDGSGRGGAAPRAGERPEIWIGIDKTPPSAELLGVAEGTGPDAGRLAIHWRAQDPFLGERPISLECSEHAGGPWTRIASGIPNTGHYAWLPDRSVPEQFFVRLVVHDEAGNSVAVDALQPVTLRPYQPQGRIRNVRPVNGPSASRIRNPYYR